MRRASLAFLLLLGAVSRSISAQNLVRFSPQGNEIGSESRIERWGTNGQPRSLSLAFGAWMTLSLQGMLVSPRLLSWSMSVRPYSGQQSGSSETSESGLRNTGMSLGANLLSGFPVSASLYSQRSAGRMSSATGGTSDFQTSSAGATVLWRNDPIPVTLTLSRRSTDDAWQTSPSATPLFRDEVLTTSRLEARSSKLAVAMERLDFIDRLGALDFASRSLVADHTLRWGKGSWLATQLQSERRTGSFSYDRGGGGIRLQVQHTGTTTSSIFADQRNGTTAGSAVRQRGAGYELRNRTRNWLTLSGSGSWHRSTQGQVDVATSRLGARGEFVRLLPRGVRLTASSAANLERIDRNLGDRGSVFVFAEPHRIEETRGFDMPVVGVEVASIVVRSTDQTVLYLIDTDYTIITNGANVRIQILPGGRLNSGDVVLVDYRYTAMDAGRHDVLGVAGDAFLGTDAVSVWVAEGLRVAQADAGVADALSLGGRDRVLGVTMRRAIGGGRFTLEASRRSRTRSVADVGTRDLRTTWAPFAGGSTRWSVGARAATSTARGQRQTSASTDATFAWIASSGVQILSGAEWWLWKPDGTAETYLTANAELVWRFGQVEMNARYVFQQRTLIVDSDQHRGTLRVVRRF